MLHFWNLHQIWNILNEKMTLIVYVFPKLRTVKDVVTWMYKKSRCRIPFGKQHGQRSKTVLKSARQHLYHIYWSVWRKMSWKKSLSVICKIFIQFANSLTAHGKHSLVDRDNLTQPIQIDISQKIKLFPEFFPGFLKSRSTFEHFEKKKMTLIGYLFTKVRTEKDVLT